MVKRIKMVRCKLYLAEVTAYGGSGSKKYVFRAQYDQSIPEDQRFAKASPSGEFTIIIDNPSAQEKFEVGKAYYFDAVPCEAV